ncbi:MAG: PilZ domain-containing protein [Cellvibrionaceae bacterium]
MMKTNFPIELTAEELQLLGEVCKDSGSHLPAESVGDYPIAKGVKKDPISHLLMMSEHLTMEARLGRYQLIFSPFLYEDPISHETRIEMGYPMVYDTEGVSRSKRIQPEGNEVQVIDSKVSVISQAKIRDISTSGLSLELPEGTLPPETQGEASSLTLLLPCDTQVEIGGVIVRDGQGGDRSLAIQFDHIDREGLEALKAFVFERTKANSLELMEGVPEA